MADQRDGPDCTCGGKIAKGRRDGFCSSFCRARDEQGLPPQSPPPLFSSGSPPPAALVAGTPPGGPTSAADRDASGDAPGGVAATVAQPDPDEPKRPRYRERRRLIADEVEARIEQAGMSGTWQAAAALDLADSLDWQGGSGSARAALHKQLRDVMADLLRGQSEPGSKVGAMRDEVAERRARRAQRAGGAV